MSWKKMVFGEKMPDKDDPKYKERYKKEVAAGRKAARLLKLDKAAGGVQRFACKHPRVVSCHCVRHCADLLGA